MDTFYKSLATQAYDKVGNQFTSKSAAWFMSKMKAIKSTTVQANILADARRKGLPEDGIPKIGKMYTFFYDAKTKDKLPYWDKFPLIFLVDGYNDGFLGINLHYLPVRARGIFMYKLLGLRNNDKMDETTKLRLSYQILKGSTKYKEMAPCVKRYLFAQCRSRLLNVPADEWEAALYMPSQRFTVNPAKVWKDSLNKI